MFDSQQKEPPIQPAANIQKTNKQKQDTDNQKKQQNQESKEVVYFMSFVCSPELLEDPHNSKKRFSNDLWSDKFVKSIKKMSHYIQIAINHKNNVPVKKQLTEQYNLSDISYKKQLESVKNSFTNDYPLLKKKIQSKHKYNPQHEFDSWLKTMKGKNFIGWFMPLRDQGPKLRKLAISKQTVKLLGYAPEQFHFQFQKYSHLAFELLNGTAYKTAFLKYLTSFRKFTSMELRGDISLQDCIKQSQCILMNQMKGKNEISVKVEMKWYMPNMCTVCYQMLRVVQQKQFKDHEMIQLRNNVMSKVEKTTFHSLSRITRLPKDMNPANTNKICSYIVLRESSIIEQSQKSCSGSSNFKFQQQNN